MADTSVHGIALILDRSWDGIHGKHYLRIHARIGNVRVITLYIKVGTGKRRDAAAHLQYKLGVCSGVRHTLPLH